MLIAMIVIDFLLFKSWMSLKNSLGLGGKLFLKNEKSKVKLY